MDRPTSTVLTALLMRSFRMMGCLATAPLDGLMRTAQTIRETAAYDVSQTRVAMVPPIATVCTVTITLLLTRTATASA